MAAASPTRVLFLNSCISGGGAGRSLESMLTVADARIAPLVALPGPGVLASRLEGIADLVYIPEFVERMKRSPWSWPDRTGMPWMHLPCSVAALLRCIGDLTRLVRAVRPQVIHCNHMLAKPVGAAVGARTGVPVVFHSRACHRLWIDGSFYSWLGGRGQVRRIICNSEASAAVYRRHSEHKVTVIPNGIDLDAYRRDRVRPVLRRDHGIGADDFVVGFVGRIQESKGLSWLLRAFAAFARQRPRARLAIVGGNDGSLHFDALEHYRREAAGLGLDRATVFTGYQDDVRPHIADFDVLVMPSLLPESFGRVLLEAMALEVPVITAAHGGAIEVVREGREGLWVGVGDETGLARAIERLHADPALRRSLGQNGRIRVQSRYDRVGTARAVYDVLVEAARASDRRSDRRSATVPERPVQ